MAGPNDVLVSSTLRDLVIGSGIEFEERGVHELKGVPGEWRLFAVASLSCRKRLSRWWQRLGEEHFKPMYESSMNRKAKHPGISQVF
jgi:hypothetical protein